MIGWTAPRAVQAKPGLADPMRLGARPATKEASQMAREVMERWMPGTLAELRDALDEMIGQVFENGEGNLEAVYVDVRDLALVKETLTDGSVVFNVVVRERAGG